MANYAEILQQLGASRRENERLTAMIEQIRQEKEEKALEAMDLREEKATRDYEDLILHNERQADFGELTYRNWELREENRFLTHRVEQLENEVMDWEFIQQEQIPEFVPHVEAVEIVLEDAPSEDESELE